MIIKTKYKFGDILYIKTDPDQNEHTLVAVIQEPGALVLRLRCYDGETYEVYDFEVSDTKNSIKAMGIDPKDVEEDGE